MRHVRLRLRDVLGAALGSEGTVGPTRAVRGSGRAPPTIGWHYLSNATCLMRPHVFYGIACLIWLIDVFYMIHHL